MRKMLIHDRMSLKLSPVRELGLPRLLTTRISSHYEYASAFIFTLYNVCSAGCSVHQGDIMSILGISWVHQGMFSASKGCHEYNRWISWVHRGECHEYIEGCSEHWRDIINILRGYDDSCGVVELMDKSLSLILETATYPWHPPQKACYPPPPEGMPSMYWTSPPYLSYPPT